MSRTKAILPSLSPSSLSLILLVCRHSMALLVSKPLKAKSCSLEHVVSVDSTKHYTPRLQPRPPTAKDDTQHSSWSAMCTSVHAGANTVWTNISNWEINHCSKRSFRVAESRVRGRRTRIDKLCFYCKALFRGAVC